jgi:hypothetical protein
VIDRKEVRSSVEHRFSANRMVDEYLEVYRQIMDIQREKRVSDAI